MTDRTDAAMRLAGEHEFQTELVRTSNFKLRVFHKGLDRTGFPLRVYIEGDGYAWRNRHHLSDDPTPRDPVGLRLAVADPGEAVLYIARPCQFLEPTDRSACHPRYWSSHRYAEKVINAVNEVIDYIAGKFESVHLIGYSGGGSVAALVAARRDDVKWLMTVASNLDHREWTDLHRVSPLHGSLNAVDIATSLQGLPQNHLAGDRDHNVPPAIVRSFTNKINESSSVTVSVISNYDHECCWVNNWVELLCRYSPETLIPACQAQ